MENESLDKEYNLLIKTLIEIDDFFGAENKMLSDALAESMSFYSQLIFIALRYMNDEFPHNDMRKYDSLLKYAETFYNTLKLQAEECFNK